MEVTGDLLTARYLHTATLLPNGQVLVAGGWLNDLLLASAELYDPADKGVDGDRQHDHSTLAIHTATLLPNGQVLVAGGSGITTILATAELYDPATGMWTATGSMPLHATSTRRRCCRMGRCCGRRRR